MKLARTKNASRNIFFGIILKVYQILVPFIMRTAMINFMGVQYLGLNSLFTSILQVLNLAELGVGSAMVYSMYKPIAEDDKSAINALLGIYRSYYNVIGAAITGLGVLVMPFIPKLIRGDVPTGINIYILYLLYLGATVLSYWLLAYKNSILQAHQRIDIVSKVTLVTNTIQYSIQFLVLWLFKNYYLYVIVMLATQAITNVIIAVVAVRLYPDFKPEGKLEKDTVKEINQRIKDLFTAKLGAVIVNSTDTIVISAFLGLTVLAVYQNYYFILTAVIGFVEVIFSACTAGIGNSLIIDSKEKNFNDLKSFTFIISWIAGFSTCCFLNLYQPFMELWVGKKLMLEFTAVVCFCIYFFIYVINRLLNTYKDAGGIWHQDRFRPLVTAIVNLCLNLVMVEYWGIYGIILSTVLSMAIVGMPWLILNLFTTLFDKVQLSIYLKKLFTYIVVTFVSCLASKFVCSYINNNLVITILLRMIICFIIPNIIFLITFFKTHEFKESIELIDKITKGKLNLKRVIL